MSSTATPTKAARHRKRAGTTKPSKAPAKIAKPTKWGKDMLLKMDALRKALAAQK